MGYNYLKEQKSDPDRSNKTLKEQLAEISFQVLKRIKIFSLLVRFFISILLFIIIALDVYLGVYNTSQSYGLIAILFIYISTVIFLLRQTRHLSQEDNLHNYFDFIYVTLEIVAVYFAVLIFPTHPANIYANSLRGFWFTLIVLSAFTGKWYYGFYTGSLVAILNLTYLFQYNDISLLFKAQGMDFKTIIPSFQVIVSSIYYVLTGAFVSFPFYLFDKQQTLALNAKTENIVAKPYYELSMQESDVQVGDYLISKIVTSIDVVGADYVCLKQVNSEEVQACLIVGDTIGHGLNRSPGAIITMAAFMANLSNDSLDIQKAINNVLFKIDKDSGGKTYCLTLILKKDGIVEYAGKAENFRLIKNGMNNLELKQSGEILGIEPELTYTFKQEVKLNHGDMLVIQTDGAVFDSEEDDKTIVMISRNNYLS